MPTPTAKTESRVKTSREHFTIRLYLSETLGSMFIPPSKKSQKNRQADQVRMAHAINIPA
jgi:hypothetical protein